MNLARLAAVPVFALSLTCGVASAQVATVAIVAPGATDANLPADRVVVATVPAACGLPKAAEPPPPLINPEDGRYDDPANAARDCSVNVGPMVTSLPAATGYRAALKLDTGPYGPLSTAFSRQITATHPCAGTAPTVGTVLEGSRLLTWCWNGLDVAGNPATVTAWAVYVGTVRSLLSNVIVGTAVDTDGERLYSAALAVTRGARVLSVAAVTAVGEATVRPTFALTVQAPAALPSGATIRGVQ